MYIIHIYLSALRKTYASMELHVFSLPFLSLLLHPLLSTLSLSLFCEHSEVICMSFRCKTTARCVCCSLFGILK